MQPMKKTQPLGGLAISGGQPAVRAPLPPMYPGGLRIGEEEETAVLEVLRTKRLFRYYGPNPGPSKVAELEERFAKLMGVPYAVAVTSGSAALLCGLVALGVGPGDEVIVPAYTWIASAEAVMGAGAVPVVAEVDESLSLDPVDMERRITSRTKAIMPVHIRGTPADMDAIMAVAKKHNLGVIEDVAQSDGASYKGKPLGSIGDVGAFSFQFNKILTAGEGGAVITKSRELYDRAVMVHDVVGGSRNKIPAERIIPGLNFRMSELQGAVMLVQLERLEGLLRDMRHYKAILKGAVTDIAQSKGVKFRVIHDEAGDAAISLIMFAPTHADAKRVSSALNAEGAPNFVIYDPGRVDYHIYTHWEPVVRHASWSQAGAPWCWHPGEVSYGPEQCPRTLQLLSRAVHMDISPELTSENIEELAEAINKVLEGVL
jgi:8-amino-3,8-dideoxy-alpha-D-manno-octulosonate transaminase